MTHHVYRWHNNADPRLRDSKDTIDRHQKAVQTLCHSLAAHIGHPLHDSDLPRWTAVHDEPEKIMGDWPADLTRRYWFARFAKAVLEWLILRAMGIPGPRLTRKERKMFKLCDRLEAYLWADRLGCTGCDEWDRDLAKLRRRAYALGPDAMAWLEGQLTRKGVAAWISCASLIFSQA